MPKCTHTDTVNVTELPASVDGCEDCLALDPPGQWLHLRLCLECGHVGCCDDSPGQHATGHFKGTGHPIIRSIEPGETWSWCYIDEGGVRVELAGEVELPPAPLG
ncbi:MAG: UBP-type zinc finger domain-containing protein [Solirubrobacteraceae bacterium]|nr:UBP-type zinc finger domain-containing protein [Solirubrobacteraceae bacterium]